MSSGKRQRAIKRRNRFIVISALVVILLIVLIAFIISSLVSKSKPKTNDANPSSSNSSSSTISSEFNSQASSSTETLTTDEKKEYVLSHLDEYPEELVTFMNKYNQVINYVYNYKNINNLPKGNYESIDKTKTGFPLIIQWDARWGYQKYGTSFIGTSSCAPACLAMAYKGLTKKDDQTIVTITRLCETNCNFVDGSGTNWALMTSVAKEIGINSKVLPLSESSIKSELDLGHPVIMNMSKGDFTQGGHYILVVGYEDSKLIINDPNSPENSGKLWDFSAISSQIKNLWALSI